MKCREHVKFEWYKWLDKVQVYCVSFKQGLLPFEFGNFLFMFYSQPVNGIHSLSILVILSESALQHAELSFLYCWNWIVLIINWKLHTKYFQEGQ